MKNRNLNLKENPAILAKRRYIAEHIKEMDPNNRKIKFSAFLRKYGRVLIGGAIILAVLFCAIFAPLLTEWNPNDPNIPEAKLKPGEVGQLENGEEKVHVFGTDIYGRDMWARLIFGSRSTLLVSLGAQVIMTVSGTLLGLLCGYYTKVEKYLMRVLDAVATIPSLLLCLLMVAVFAVYSFFLRPRKKYQAIMKQTLEETPPELSSDIFDLGIPEMIPQIIYTVLSIVRICHPYEDIALSQ